jgi:hypothetical protein
MIKIEKKHGNIWETRNAELFLVFGHAGMGLSLGQPFQDLNAAFDKNQPLEVDGKTYFLLRFDSIDYETLRVKLNEFLNYAKANNFKHLVTNGANDVTQPFPANSNPIEHKKRQCERSHQIYGIIRSWDKFENTENSVESITLISVASDFNEYLGDLPNNGIPNN